MCVNNFATPKLISLLNGNVASEASPTSKMETSHLLFEFSVFFRG